MKKKVVIIGAVAIIIIIVAVLDLTNLFTIGDITGKLYRVDNVYEEIRNLVNSERNRRPTILSTSIPCSEVDYDFGFFEHINIPVNDEYTAVLSFYYDELDIWLFEKTGDNHDVACYVYNYQSNTLYGNREEELLIDNFISSYFSWAGESSKFNPDDRGNYTYVYAEYPLSHTD